MGTGRRSTWPAADRRHALTHDLVILVRRGLSVQQAAQQLRVPTATAYRWLEASR